MRRRDSSDRWARVAGGTVLASAFSMLVLGLLFSEALFQRFDPSPPLLEPTVRGIRHARLAYLAAGSGLAVVWLLSRRWARLRSGLARPAAARATLALVCLTVPLAILEIAGRPFIEPKTIIFQRDPDLGWKLRPGADDRWLGTRVRINGKGLRGPELSYAKPPGATRILFLGDSVAFGVHMEDHARTFPYRIERLLEERGHPEIQTINAAVGGYSPWQHHAYLEREGVRYDPDLVVVSFVLNDVVEEALLSEADRLPRRYQLRRAASSTWDRLSSRSGLVLLAVVAGRRLRWGSELDIPAPHEDRLNMRTLIRDPNRPGAARAWEVTLESLGRVFDSCGRHGIAAVLIVFPYRVQLADPEDQRAPQRLLRRFADERGIPMIDLLPALGGERSHFLDEVHLSASGHERVAAAVADFLEKRGFPERGQD